ncbi:hypothetical protein CKAH01_15454 [Colletotrichum kahawae]|uniref:Uncharacterized protein n=1 Tax=Colletotrichum kahawae TaxID=34407 RepID=A0AAD9YG94_COLKA|nr:hypothetical protein CKAH01_15454 [Colletotrichum kahawae]
MLRHSSVLLLFFLLWIATAHQRHPRHAVAHVSLRRAEPNGTEYCSLETCGAKNSAGQCPSRLNPRVLKAPDPSTHPVSGRWYGPDNYGNNVDSFFRGEIAKRADNQTDIVPIYGGEVTSAYIPFKDEPRSLAMLGFCGCIGLIVMSKSAVWMARVYENPVLLNADTFDENGIAVLKDGKGNTDMQYGLADLSGNVFAPGESPVAVVFAPNVFPATSGSNFVYKPPMQKIDRMVKDLIGVDPKWIGYTPRRAGSAIVRLDEDCTRSDGKVLVQYQPSNPGGFIRGKARARIWGEGESWRYQTDWSPQSDQMRN